MADLRGLDGVIEPSQSASLFSQHDLVDQLIQASGDLVIDEIVLRDRTRSQGLRAAFRVSGDERCGKGVKGLVGALRQLGLSRAGRVVVRPHGGSGDQFRIELEIDA